MSRRIILPVILCLLLASTLTPAAQADGTPVRVVLNYLNSVSNWGPTNAGGILDLIRAEGEARLTVRGLPQTAGKHYVLWLIHEGTIDVFRIGALQFQPDGSANVDLILPNPIPNQGWNLALVTAETTATPARPGPDHSVAGRFPRGVPVDAAPPELPNTGLGGAVNDTGRLPLAAWLCLVPLGVAGEFARKHYQRRL
ncbi:MAG TPA: hypothetical protein VMW65_10225 [Chloroflexota bacterium]|nr:hypothetical protein [Chloroflexota bacterium]